MGCWRTKTAPQPRKPVPPIWPIAAAPEPTTTSPAWPKRKTKRRRVPRTHRGRGTHPVRYLSTRPVSSSGEPEPRLACQLRTGGGQPHLRRVPGRWHNKSLTVRRGRHRRPRNLRLPGAGPKDAVTKLHSPENVKDASSRSADCRRHQRPLVRELNSPSWQFRRSLFRHTDGKPPSDLH